MKAQSEQSSPLFHALGKHHQFLDEQAAAEATVAERIRSVWPFMVSRVKKFQATLTHRDQVNFDAEDTLMELRVALTENDAQWEPDRGKYITYAGVIIDRELCAIRDKARTVHSPRNSSCRLKEYEEDEDNGSISPRRSKTANDIRRTTGGIFQIDTRRLPDDAAVNPIEDDNALSAADTVEAQENGGVAREAMVLAIKSSGLTKEEINVVARLAGLWGHDRASLWKIAFESGRELEEVRCIKSRAWRKVKFYLDSIKHPVSISA